MTTIASLLLADGRLPVGGHAYSAGLEPAVGAGLTAAGVVDYLAVRLATVGRVEAAATVLSHRYVRRTTTARGAAVREPPVDDLSTINNELLARSASQPLRDASGRLGRGLLRLIDRCWPLSSATRDLHLIEGGPQRPVALGVVCALSAMSETEAARLCLYDDAQAVCSAALKLLPVDPLDPVAWLLDETDVIEQLVEEAVDVVDAAALPATAAPLIEQWSLSHELSSRRLFNA